MVVAAALAVPDQIVNAGFGLEELGAEPGDEEQGHEEPGHEEQAEAPSAARPPPLPKG